jgi:hypothetical protein
MRGWIGIPYGSKAKVKPKPKPESVEEEHTLEGAFARHERDILIRDALEGESMSKPRQDKSGRKHGFRPGKRPEQEMPSVVRDDTARKWRGTCTRVAIGGFTLSLIAFLVGWSL